MRIRARLVLLLLAASTAAQPGMSAEAVARHLIYLHGRIVQDQQDPRPQHPQFGHYELEAILAALGERGFEVSGGIRPRAATVSESADRVVDQVRRLRAAGVPAGRIALVGASMGAGIALTAAARLAEPELRIVVLGSCLSGYVPHLVGEEGRSPSGRLLTIREASDDLAGECAPWSAELEAEHGVRAREIVLDTGLSHGFLYRPLPEWLGPVAEWAGGGEPESAPDPPAERPGPQGRP